VYTDPDGQLWIRKSDGTLIFDQNINSAADFKNSNYDQNQYQYIGTGTVYLDATGARSLGHPELAGNYVQLGATNHGRQGTAIDRGDGSIQNAPEARQLMPTQGQFLKTFGFLYGSSVIAGGGIGFFAPGLVAGQGLTTLGLSAPTLSTNAQMTLIGWGTTGRLLQLLRTWRVGAFMTRARVLQLMSQGLTKEAVVDLLAKYDDIIAEGGRKLTGNPQILPRKEVLEKILKLWPD
jgi:hypothetical protein